MAFVFVSYARDNLADSNRVRQDLITNQVTVWRDLEDIRKDQAWEIEIERILDSGKLSHFLYLETVKSARPESVCRDEIERAIQNGIPILRLLFEKPQSTPLRVTRLTYIDFRDDYPSALRTLIAELNKTRKLVRTQTQEKFQRSEKKATSAQIAAAHERARFIRLVAPPGTGKSFVIEERVRWLLENNFNPDGIYIVSFTRASSADLRTRIIEYCELAGLGNASSVHVSTLHSLALTVLRKAQLLDNYPVMPKVLDEWEIENIFDSDMAIEIQRSPSRCEEIRLAAEAYWATGEWTVPQHMQPEDPVTEEEIKGFKIFLDLITYPYACVLPGQIVKTCVDYIDAGILNPPTVLNTEHLVVDEYQDLNYTDMAFIHSFAERNIPLFVAGDDDQSIYSFRFAYPRGIQEFHQKYQGVVDHKLQESFRCAPAILEIADALLKQTQDPNLRIPKTVYSHFRQHVRGIGERWRFKSEATEARGIAQSCKNLIQRGVPAQDILILLSNRRVQLFKKKGQLSALEQAFKDYEIPVELSRLQPYISTDAGRLALTLLRIICDKNVVDYIAYRTLLGLLKGVGATTCNNIRRKVLANNYDYLSIFYDPLPTKVFTGRETKAIEQARSVISAVSSWTSEITIAEIEGKIGEVISENFDTSESDAWRSQLRDLPSEMNVEEVRQFLATNQDDQRTAILSRVYERLELDIPSNGFYPPKVRVMTMHGVKGLEAQVVFVPGLEVGILPNEASKKYTGLRLEAARQLYVSITRAKSAIVLSYATSRIINGTRDFNRTPSFPTTLGGRFIENDGSGLTNAQIDEIVNTVKTIQFSSGNEL